MLVKNNLYENVVFSDCLITKITSFRFFLFTFGLLVISFSPPQEKHNLCESVLLLTLICSSTIKRSCKRIKIYVRLFLTDDWDAI